MLVVFSSPGNSQRFIASPPRTTPLPLTFPAITSSSSHAKNLTTATLSLLAASLMPSTSLSFFFALNSSTGLHHSVSTTVPPALETAAAMATEHVPFSTRTYADGGRRDGRNEALKSE